MGENLETRLIDKRTYERHLRTGQLDEKVFERYLKSLPDLSEKAAQVETQVAVEEETATHPSGDPSEPTSTQA